jgi:agmatine deiminase
MQSALSKSKTPLQSGYRMPAEWELHAGTWLTWPRPEGISFPDKYDTVPPVYAELIRHLTQVEEVNINVWNAEMESRVRGLLQKCKAPLERVRFHHFPAYEPWCRDHGPIFLVRERDGKRERSVVDWGYNAWGNKYPPFDLDDAIPQRCADCRFSRRAS